jgi:hypothetical protein
MGVQTGKAVVYDTAALGLANQVTLSTLSATPRTEMVQAVR